MHIPIQASLTTDTSFSPAILLLDQPQITLIEAGRDEVRRPVHLHGSKRGKEIFDKRGVQASALND